MNKHSAAENLARWAIAHLTEKGYEVRCRYGYTFHLDKEAEGNGYLALEYSSEDLEFSDSKYLYGIDGTLAADEKVMGLVSEIPSCQQLRLKRMLEAIELIKSEAPDIGVELPEGWTNPLTAFAEKLRTNILEAPKAEATGH